MIKWHLPHSIHGEHRGRTQKCPIQNHRVEYNYSKIITVRIAIDRSNSLGECPIEFEVLQEFSAAGVAGAVGRDEKITLGTVRLNLSEFVEESEAILRDGGAANAAAIREALSSSPPAQKSAYRRPRSSLSNVIPADEASPRSSHEAERPTTASDVQDGVVRRYLMQESKINSTLKISILMIQVEGERNFVAPPPKSAPVFGGIAGLVAGDALEPVDVGISTPGHAPSSFTGKSRDMFEIQDVYRRALAASWASQPGELPADRCIEDIFAGGEGFPSPPKPHHGRGYSRHHLHHHHHSHHHRHHPSHSRGDDPSPDRRRTIIRQDDSGGSFSDDEEAADMMGTLRPRDLTRFRRHLRDQSAASDRSQATIMGDRDLERESSRGLGLAGPQLREPFPAFPAGFQHRREESKITHDGGGLRSRSSSLVSLATTMGGSERGRGGEGVKRAREVDEFEVREDLVAWTIAGGQA
ncbi:N-terminal C2 in EEIG1 and EHBP1 proteins-domain-containing protein [Staphylotrichum tortipilum]|uniref:N-terminal C2 in EEIG1 and EHBP1 proteins-domain-containing protein n=1 Tax=Staphylotrichum tortipilum TaxID=2831512 RepID=A0AAN6MHN0_9PEZI|nr:N-terminal C2 in EEIG1 and EHBP1 proteins-domain-containing protein [Staphylotrichum longicolle]